MPAEAYKEKLNSIITDICKAPSLFVKHPGKDFTRDRKLPLETMLKIIIGMEGGSLNRELYDYDHSLDVTASAFVQLHDKMLPEMFGYIFSEFNRSCSDEKTYRGYRLLVVDGSGVSIATDPDAPTYVENGSLAGYNSFHLNALYDHATRLTLTLS